MNLDSPISPIKRVSMSPERTISPINPQVMDSALVLNNNNKNLANHNHHNSPSRESVGGGELESRNNSSPMRVITGEERISPRSESKDQISYIQSELDALEREQEAIDLKASALEGKLRAVMGGGSGKLNKEAGI